MIGLQAGRPRRRPILRTMQNPAGQRDTSGQPLPRWGIYHPVQRPHAQVDGLDFPLLRPPRPACRPPPPPAPWTGVPIWAKSRSGWATRTFPTAGSTTGAPPAVTVNSDGGGGMVLDHGLAFVEAPREGRWDGVDGHEQGLRRASGGHLEVSGPTESERLWTQANRYRSRVTRAPS